MKPNENFELNWISRDRSVLVTWLGLVMMYHNKQTRSAEGKYRILLMLAASYFLIRVMTILDGNPFGRASDYVAIATACYWLFMAVLHNKVWLLLDDYHQKLDEHIEEVLNLKRSEAYFYPLPYDPMTKRSHWNPFNDQCWEGATPVLIHDWSSQSPSYLAFRLDFAELIVRDIDFATSLFIIFWYRRGDISLTSWFKNEISKSHKWVSLKFLQSLPSAVTLSANIELNRN